MSDEKPTPKPLIPVLTERELKIASENKAWILEVQDHNDTEWMSWPYGEGLTLGGTDRAYGAYPHRYACPIMFHDSSFKQKFISMSYEPAFLMHHGECDFTLKLPKKEKRTVDFDTFMAEIKAKRAQGSTQPMANGKTATRTIGVNLKAVFEASLK